MQKIVISSILLIALFLVFGCTDAMFIQSESSNFKECLDASDCVIVDSKNCCSEGYESINKNYLISWEKQFESEGCELIECNAKAIRNPYPSCVNNACKITEYDFDEFFDPVDLRNCLVSSDCVSVPVKSCCLEYEAINKKYINYWENDKYTPNCKVAKCVTNLNYTNPIVTCKANNCITVEGNN
ncbi:MAG: hypothetical protein PHD05_03065 [Sphaerochaetaceae bacterium]|nr:hypothetical protein [Sphaerochaetaceae bacterium]